jgi:hypothetical protein
MDRQVQIDRQTVASVDLRQCEHVGNSPTFAFPDLEKAYIISDRSAYTQTDTHTQIETWTDRRTQTDRYVRIEWREGREGGGTVRGSRGQERL